MDTNSFLLNLHSLILEIFNKEAILIFVVFCLMIFALAGIFAAWAFRNGEFSDMESSKFEMLEEGI